MYYAFACKYVHLYIIVIYLYKRNRYPISVEIFTDKFHCDFVREVFSYITLCDRYNRFIYFC